MKLSLRVLLSAVVCLLPLAGRADRPYAPTRAYDLQAIRTHLRFEVSQRKVIGEVNESISILAREADEIRFDSADLTITSVSVDDHQAKFSATPEELVVRLPEGTAKRGEHHEVLIRYSGQPRAGLYFVLPDEYYPNQPVEVWTQGEAEDTHHYIPIYDYPNDRLTSEMILTVPAGWVTVSNGKLLSVKNETDGTKTWDWKQDQPISTYLISLVAGEFVERDDSWHGVPLRYVVPRGREPTIPPTFARSKAMLDTFSETLGVPYPWAQFAQSAVDNFVTGGMENATAVTVPVSTLIDAAMAPEYHIGPDIVESHELAHQWFGDLVTCHDWANLWLNEGFATFFEHYWLERRYDAGEADYEFWRDQQQWLRETRDYPVPIVDHNFTDSTDHSGNIYTKGAWVLRMLRAELGDQDFFRALHDYLERNRGKNVVTADLERSIEESTGVSVAEFFHQWIYRAGAPRLSVSYTYDAAGGQVKLTVTQTQKIEGFVGLFHVPVEVEIATASGRKTYPIEIDQENQAFSFLVDGPPLMILFDKGDQVLKSVEFAKPPDLLIYQLKNAASVPDRADAALALGQVKSNSAAVAALGEAARSDTFWGIRAEALRALGRIGGADATAQVVASLDEKQPWVREIAVQQLGNFREEPSLASKLTQIARADSAFRVRGAALEALANFRTPEAFEVLSSSVDMDSPGDTIRAAALQAFGTLDDPRAAPVLIEWSRPGQPYDDRDAAIAGMANLDKPNNSITKALTSYLKDPNLDLRLTTVFALAERGDPEAVGPLEELLRGGTLTSDERPHVERAIEILTKQAKR